MITFLNGSCRFACDIPDVVDVVAFEPTDTSEDPLQASCDNAIGLNGLRRIDNADWIKP